VRPIKLKMDAFGPYAGTQTIDFRDATDAGLFGIYGPTGSGKSSIFSAMTFALFGEAAKKEQPTTTLRSAHASAELPTEVAFVFELGDRRYLVRRQPEQSRPKVRGDGETSQAHAAWLFDVTGIEVDMIDLNGCGVILAEKKVGQVADQVSALLGYGAEQFRQIVLLPQGRFEKFLTSDSSERLKILRELFDVSLYRTITDRLKEEASAAKREVRDGYSVHAGRLVAEGFASSDELEEAIEEARMKSRDAASESAEKEKAAAKADRAYAAAQAFEARFVEADRAKEQLKVLEGQEDEITEIRLRRDNARKAQRAADKAQAIHEAGELLSKAVQDAEEALAAANDAADGLKEAEAALLAERKRSGEIEGLQRQKAELDRYEKALADASDLRDSMDEAFAAREVAEQAHDAASLEVDRLTALQKENETAFGQARQSELRRLALQSERVTLAAGLRHAKTYQKAADALNTAQASAESAGRYRDTAEDAHAAASESYDRAEVAYLSAQASILAHRLIDGEPCPVCGAEDHPHPALGDGDPNALAEELAIARETLSSAAGDLQEARIAYGSAQSLLAEREKALLELDVPEGDVASIERELEVIDAELSGLSEAGEIEKLQLAMDEAKEQLEIAAKALSKAQQELQSATTAEAVARRSYGDQIAGVPEQYRDKADLNAAREETVDAIAERQQAFAAAEANGQAAREHVATANANLKNAEKTKIDAEKRCNVAREQFATRLAELGLSSEQYDEFAGDIPEIDDLTETVEAFETSLREAKGAAKQAAEAIAGIQRPDLASAQGSRDAARMAASEAVDLAATMRANFERLEKLKNELAEELARLRRLEEETGPLRALADAFSGQNEMNTTLESFAIGAMFDQVLEAANLRLGPMTSGRYRLERDVETAGGRSKRGLDIRIHDIETGRPRDLTTLSGGETFIAALSLALGLADIVEASHGAIRLDTIFIDEGFGSLDTENDTGTLDRVLQVLQDIVGASRAVGLISHVQLVQQAVPNGFTILKGVGGSTIERRAA
jgi:exonuclease SbcC